MSIFSDLDVRTNESESFWCKLAPWCMQDITDNLIFEEEMYLRSETLQLEKRWIILTKTTLYCCNNSNRNPEKQSIITWKQINSFVDEMGSKKRYGLTIGVSVQSQEFFLKSKISLDAFLEYLSQVAILCDFESEYIVIKPIDSGSYAIVYLVHDSLTHEEFAAKSIDKQTILSSSRGTSSITSEISIMKSISHPLFVKLHKVYEDRTHVHLIMDYVPGGTLFDRIAKNGRFSELEASALFKNLLIGVQYLQTLNIIHRDLKPTNILMCSKVDNSQCKILDFGLSCYVSSGTRMCGGSPGFMAPEIFQKVPCNLPSDNFSLGVILFIMLAARSPFPSHNGKELLAVNREGIAVFDTRDWNGISKEAIDLVTKLMNPSPQDRATLQEAINHKWINPHCNLKPIVLEGPMIGSIGSVRPVTGISINLMDRIIHRTTPEDLKANMLPNAYKMFTTKKDVSANSRIILMRLREQPK